MTQAPGRIGYLSGAPRVSTRSDAEDGGPRAHVLGTIGGFRQLGWKVDPFIIGDHVPRSWVASGSYEKKRGGIVKKALVDGVRLGMRFKNNVRVRRVLHNRPDFVYERFGCMQALGLPFKRAGVPWVLETNALVFNEFKLDSSSVYFSRVARALELSAYRRCDALVCVSQKLKDLVIAEAGIPESKIIVLPNGVDTDFFYPAAADSSQDARVLSIGFVGTFFAWQALDLLLEAVHELRQRQVNLHVTLIGDGPERANLMRQAEHLGIQDHVLFAGRLPRDKIPAAMAEFDLGYSGHRPTSSGEMYMSPLKLYEYMAVGKPVIVSRHADSDELIADGDTGFTFVAGDKASLKQAIERALADRQAMPAMGRRARAVIEQNHSWKKRVETLIEELEPIIGTDRVRPDGL